MKKTKEQREAASLNTSLDPSPQQKQMYEVATYRSARKMLAPKREKGTKTRQM